MSQKASGVTCSNVKRQASSVLPTLIYIVGEGRSGSTVLGVMLGAHPQIASVGELSKWAQFRGFPKPGDGKAGDAAFWAAVRAKYFAQRPATSLDKLADLQREIDAYRNFPRLLCKGLGEAEARVYEAHVQNLLTAIGRVAQRPVVVDTSKAMGGAVVLSRCAGVRVVVLHLVRHPCGVVWSQMKRGVEQRRKPFFTAICHYAIKHLFCAMLSARTPVLRLRYEDLIGKRGATLERLGRHIGLSMTPVIEAIEQPLPVRHLLDGNRIRQASEIQLTLDDAWQRGLNRVQKAVIVGLTLPFVLAYGYWGNAECRMQNAE